MGGKPKKGIIDHFKDAIIEGVTGEAENMATGWVLSLVGLDDKSEELEAIEDLKKDLAAQTQLIKKNTAYLLEVRQTVNTIKTTVDRLREENRAGFDRLQRWLERNKHDALLMNMQELLTVITSYQEDFDAVARMPAGSSPTWADEVGNRIRENMRIVMNQMHALIVGVNQRTSLLLLWEKGLDLKLVGPSDYDKIRSRFEYYRSRQVQALNLLVESIHHKVVRDRKPVKGAKSVRELMRESGPNALATAVVETFERNIQA